MILKSTVYDSYLSVVMVKYDQNNLRRLNFNVGEAG